MRALAAGVELPLLDAEGVRHQREGHLLPQLLQRVQAAVYRFGGGRRLVVAVQAALLPAQQAHGKPFHAGLPQLLRRFKDCLGGGGHIHRGTDEFFLDVCRQKVHPQGDRFVPFAAGQHARLHQQRLVLPRHAGVAGVLAGEEIITDLRVHPVGLGLHRLHAHAHPADGLLIHLTVDELHAGTGIVTHKARRVGGDGAVFLAVLRHCQKSD